MMRVDPPATATTAAAFDLVLQTRGIHCVFQPILSLQTHATLGYEALARGPAGTALSTPDALFRYAGKVGRLPELDWICRAAACRAALAADLPVEMPLFINVEPSSSRTPCPPDLVDVIDAATRRLQIVAEVTERSVTRDPAGLLASIRELRGYSNRIALDDVGADTSSQAMMSLLRPDVIKVDRTIIQGPITPDACSVINAVLAEAERTGAVILAEGIETKHHLGVARSIGATFGQGWLFGHAGPLPKHFEPSGTVLPRIAVSPVTGVTPFEIARQSRATTQTTKEMLIPLSQHLENKGVTATEPTVLLATFQNARYFDKRTRDRYSGLAAHGIFTAAYAYDMPLDPGPHIRGCPLESGDPLIGEWTVIVIGSHFAGGLFAKATGDSDEEMRRVFDIVISHDRELVLAAANPLLQRLVPMP
jgi:EAL domain-containing protein (putative c-di-GMP-specific phosphodiesterase class I)